MNDRKIEFSIRPEMFRILFYLSFWFLISIGIVVTVIFSPHSLQDNIILRTFGTNNVCIFFDDPPSTYITPFLWGISLILFFLYMLFSSIQQYIMLINNAISKVRFCVRIGIYSLTMLMALFFSTVFAVKPTESIALHTIPYLTLVLILSFYSVSSSIYHYRYFKFNPLVVFYVYLYNIATVFASFVVIFRLLYTILWGIDPPWLSWVPPIDKFWFTLVGVFPLFHAIYLYRITPNIKICLSGDLKI